MIRVDTYRLAMATLGIVVGLVAGSAQAGAPRPEDLGVIPTPQEVTGPPIPWASTRQRRSSCPARRQMARNSPPIICKSVLHEQTGLNLQITQDAGTVTAPKLIAIGNPKTDPRVAELMKTYGLTLTDAMAKEGYVLGIGNEGIVIGADSGRGLAVWHSDSAADAGLPRSR